MKCHVGTLWSVIQSAIVGAPDCEAMTDVQHPSHQDQQPDGFFSSTAGTYFADKEALQEHYRSDFHRYNLKRKVAGLPPVTREWFDARKEQLNLAAGGNASKVRCQRSMHGAYHGMHGDCSIL